MVVMLPAGAPPTNDGGRAAAFLSVSSFAGNPGPRPTFMKAILEFNLPEEQHEHQDALQGSDWKWALSELADYLRNQIKHADNSAEEYRTFERVREQLFEILDGRGLDLYE